MNFWESGFTNKLVCDLLNKTDERARQETVEVKLEEKIESKNLKSIADKLCNIVHALNNKKGFPHEEIDKIQELCKHIETINHTITDGILTEFAGFAEKYNSVLNGKNDTVPDFLSYLDCLKSLTKLIDCLMDQEGIISSEITEKILNEEIIALKTIQILTLKLSSYCKQDFEEIKNLRKEDGSVSFIISHFVKVEERIRNLNNRLMNRFFSNEDEKCEVKQLNYQLSDNLKLFGKEFVEFHCRNIMRNFKEIQSKLHRINSDETLVPGEPSIKDNIIHIGFLAISMHQSLKDLQYRCNELDCLKLESEITDWVFFCFLCVKCVGTNKNENGHLFMFFEMWTPYFISKLDQVSFLKNCSLTSFINNVWNSNDASL